MSEIIREVDLKIEIPVNIVKIKELEIEEELNEHGKCKIKVVAEEDKFKIIEKIGEDFEIKIGAEVEGKIKILFIGIVTYIKVKREEKVHELEIELKSKSYRLDIKKKRRSFQDVNREVESLVKEIVSENGGIGFYTARKKELQNRVLIQYDETDWEFLKRVSFGIQEKLVTKVNSEDIYINLGVLEVLEEKQEEIYDFKFVKERQLSDKDRLKDKGYFEIESTKEYSIYDKIIYNRIIYRVVKKNKIMLEGVLVTKYYLLKEGCIDQDVMEDKKLEGISIKGKVLDIRQDRVQVHLEIDVTQKKEEAYWFKYESVYAAEGQTGVYTMPQEGEEVVLYFPKGIKELGFVRSVYRNDKKKNIKIEDPNIKYYGTINEKEIMLAQKEIQITATNGMILINMNEEEGIEITSSEDILVHATDEVKVEGNNIGLRAGNEILLRTTASNVIIGEEIHLKGINGLKTIQA